MRVLLPALLVLATCGLSHGGVPSPPEKRNVAKQLPEFSPAPQLPTNSSSTLKALYEPYSKNTPKFQNHALMRHLANHPGTRLDQLDAASLSKRQDNGMPVGTCAPGKPCSNGACCSDTGVCSFAPSSCAENVCISNCNATAPCGQYGDPESASCPLNVCCSEYGFCGSTDEFCGSGCQTGFGGCGPPPAPSCSASSNTAMRRRIGYYESWATTRPCDVVEPEDLELASLTHINFAFAFFHPSTFQISPMDANAASLYSRFTALKTKKPGLQTWIAVGGWSFNDPTNTPDTQHAFSDMVGSHGNRQAFITSLLNFMQTYGFDGVDLDWEYPVADDRGGRPADFSNFSVFLAELRSSLGSRYGISLTLPSSYWYLRHFDVLGLEPYVDWFNFMSYDIHGVWDAGNDFTGPYIRPHTNLTEIRDGLSLLWRAGVDPAKVVLGLGWYGRSFTLADPSCNEPNGVCQFTTGGAAGECTQASGVLSNAEIKRLLAAGVGVEAYDEEAAVRWLTFDTDQWVSYDDGMTVQQKVAAANSLCLGGIMIWALDQDNAAGESMNDLMGIGTANGVPPEAAEAYKDQLANATLQHAIASSCYWSLCGGSCTTGYFDVTEARGQVAGVQQNSVCPPGELQTLCCAPGTSMGTCKWEGFRGVGFPCSPACSDPEAIIVARNTNSHGVNDGGQLADLTCTGGFQAYCCTGFVPSSITNSANLALYGQTPVLSRRDTGTSETGLSLEVRDAALEKRAGPLLLGGLGALCLADLPLSVLLAPFTFGLSLAAEGALCTVAAAVAAATAAFIGFAILMTVIGWIFGGGVSHPNRGSPITSGDRLSYGQWPILDFGSSSTTSCDCVVTYTCSYGMGWDEVCDNQRWAVNKLLGGRTVYQPRSRMPNRRYASWARFQRHPAYRTLVQGERQPYDARCELDEFPMGNLEESGNNNPQGCRLVHWKGNNAQGIDFRMWKLAQWNPCSAFRRNVCNIIDNGPPATWNFGPLNGNRGPGRGKHFLDAYGFGSQTPGSECFASYSFTEQNGNVDNTMVTDHGFRVLDDDPMYGAGYGWPRQSWLIDPRPVNAGYRAYNQQPVIFQRGLSVDGNNTDSSPGVCHADLGSLRVGNGGQPAHAEALDLDYDNLSFVDMDGNPIDGRKCSVIYEEDDPASQVHIVLDEDGNIVDMYTGFEDEDSWWAMRDADKDRPATTTADPVTITVKTGIDPLASSKPRPTLPAETTETAARSGSVLTRGPFVY